MTMCLRNIQRTLSAGLAASALINVATTAHADMMITRRATYDDPRAKALGLASDVESKIFISGGKIRIDESTESIIEDKDAHRTLFLNAITRIYFATPYSEPRPRQQTFAVDAQTTSTLTTDTKTFLGHLCHRYHLTLTSKLSRVGEIIADVYVAPDLPTVDVVSANRGPAWILHDEFQKLPGMPLQMTMTQNSHIGGRKKTDVKIVSLSTSAVPDSAFAVPDDYKLVAPPPPPKPPDSGNNAP